MLKLLFLNKHSILFFLSLAKRFPSLQVKLCKFPFGKLESGQGGTQGSNPKIWCHLQRQCDGKGSGRVVVGRGKEDMQEDVVRGLAFFNHSH